MFKKILVTFLFIGLGLFIVGLALTKGDFSKSINAFTVADEYEYVEKSSSNTFKNILIDVISNNVNFHKSEDDNFKITYYESEYEKINVGFENDTLSVVGDYKKRFGFFSFNFRFKPSKLNNIDIFLPNDSYQSLDIEIVSGNIKIDGFNFGLLKAELTSGNATLKNLNVSSDLELYIVSGNANLDNINISNNAVFNLTSGSVTANNIEVNKIDSDVVSGNVKINDLKANHLIAEVTSGNLEVSIIGLKDDYKADLEVISGNIYYDGLKIKSQKLNENKVKSIKTDVTSGDIRINFKND